MAPVVNGDPSREDRQAWTANQVERIDAMDEAECRSALMLLAYILQMRNATVRGDFEFSLRSGPGFNL